MLLISKRRQFNKEIFALLIFLSFFTLWHTADAQNGYIYVHSKTLDESSSPDITYSVSGGSTVVPNFSLNDKPAQIQLADIGSSQNGRLWAVGQDNNVLYYRNAGTANWVATSVTDASRVDGGSAGTAYYVTTGGVVKSHDGTTSTTISGAINAVDIGSGWDNQPYATNSSGDIIRYSGSGTAWNAFFNNTETLVNVDVSPSDGYVYATSSSSTQAFRISSAGVGVTMDKPTDVASDIDLYDIATDALGNVFTIGFSTPGANRFVYKWISGTSWSSREVTTDQVSIITGGLGGQMWGINRLSWDVAGYPYHNIFTRALDGATNWWIDDERVRTSVTNGNSEMIAVAPGTYTITETVPGGWDLQKITIYDPSSNSTSNLGARTATVTVASNEVVHVIFQSGIVNPFTITADCSIIYTENFGTGAIGTFGSAFVGSTSYHYLNNGTPAEDGYYKIVSSGSDMNSWSQAQGFLDHTTDAAGSTGRMLAVNASYDKNEFFRRRLTGLIPGADYQFSAWIANLTPGAPIDPNVSFQIIDPTSYSVIASNTTGDLTGSTVTWTQYKLTFTATTSQIDLVLVNNNIGGSGNDLAIDDISFQVSPPDDPTTTVVNGACGSNGSITVTSPLGASYEYSINGTTYQSSPNFTNLPGGTYTVYTRFATKPLCVSTKVDQINIGICGSVWNDADGSVTQNGSETGTNTGGTIYVNLVNSSGTVVASTTVSASGSYSLTAPASTTGLKLVLTNTASSTAPGGLPTGWVNTGEIAGTGNTATQSTTLGQIELTTSTSAVTGSNFGIEVLPTPGSGTATVANSGGTSAVTAPPSAFTNVTPSTDTAPGSVTAIHITSFPSNVTSLTINGTTYTAGTFPAGGVLVPTTSTGAPTVPILVDPTNDANPVMFTYKAVDNAGKESTTTGTATLTPAPVPDLTPIIYARPGTVYGTTDITVVVDVVELLGVTTNGLVTVRVTKDALTSLTFDPNATSIGGHDVLNTYWTLDNSNTTYYIFTTTQPVLAGDKLTFGMSGKITPGASTGTLTISTVIDGGSGGEVKITNNVDADKIDFFQQ